MSPWVMPVNIAVSVAITLLLLRTFELSPWQGVLAAIGVAALAATLLVTGDALLKRFARPKP